MNQRWLILPWVNDPISGPTQAELDSGIELELGDPVPLPEKTSYIRMPPEGDILSDVCDVCFNQLRPGRWGSYCPNCDT